MGTKRANPFTKGQRVIVPRGTRISTTQPGLDRYNAGRQQTVTLFAAADGYPSEADGRPGSLPEITWSGSGGYWRRAKVTEAMILANGGVHLTIPVRDMQSGDLLERSALNALSGPAWPEGMYCEVYEDVEETSERLDRAAPYLSVEDVYDCADEGDPSNPTILLTIPEVAPDYSITFYNRDAEVSVIRIKPDGAPTLLR